MAKPHRVLSRDQQLMVLSKGDAKLARRYKEASARLAILEGNIRRVRARLDSALETLYAGAQASDSGVCVQSSQVTPSFEAAFDFVMSADTVLRELLE